MVLSRFFYDVSLLEVPGSTVITMTQGILFKYKTLKALQHRDICCTVQSGTTKTKCASRFS
jgi:hypothetical protein